jgi:Predicted hydrolase of the metallo-beta-lactamase superfamily
MGEGVSILGVQKMSNVKLCIHRAVNAIGGNCIEIVSASGQRILLDAGRPLDAIEGVKTVVPKTLDLSCDVAGVLLSHSHGDHCGMLESLPESWLVYCGKATERLLGLSSSVCGKMLRQKIVHWTSSTPFSIGPFIVTPYLIDHSAFDAYALLIQVDGVKIFYSGDFRAHGRKAIVTQALMQRPPHLVDVLIMEGTNLPVAGGEIKPVSQEDDLEKEFYQIFTETTGRVFVSWSSTNIDRLVTLFRACKKSGRILVPDLFCMIVLMRLKEFGKIPQPDWAGGHMSAVITRRMINLAVRMGEKNVVDYLKSCNAAIGATRLTENPHKWVIMARDSLVDDFYKKGLRPSCEDTWIWSMWKGYLLHDSTKLSREFFAPCRQEFIHTSGHASPDLLKDFAKAVHPNMLIPVHGEGWDTWGGLFPNLRPVSNGEWLVLDSKSTEEGIYEQ